MGKHLTLLGTDIWDWDVIGHTWVAIFLTGLMGAAAFDLFFLLPWNLMILLAGSEGPGYGLFGMLPLYALMGVCGFWWGLQFGFDSYYPKAEARLEAEAKLPSVMLQPIVIEEIVRRKKSQRRSQGS
jgi:hypothetical protein